MPMRTRLRELSLAEYEQLVAVATRRQPATTWIRNGRVLLIQTGEVWPLHIAISGQRIAYVGPDEPRVDESTQIVDAQGQVLVPGYIEPHAHPFQLYGPQALAEYALARGTTVLICDSLPYALNLAEPALAELLSSMRQPPFKLLWWARIDPQTEDATAAAWFNADRMERLLTHPDVAQAGEWTQWRDVLDGQSAATANVWRAWQHQPRLETHNPGASWRTLARVAAAGATACHESMTAEDVLNRVRLGMHAALRHSTIRPDLAALVHGLIEQPVHVWPHVFFTTDGSPPQGLVGGVIDECVHMAISSGLDPVWAYRAASYNPALYYGLAHEVGSLSPGRLADVLFLEDLRAPTPLRVMADGVWVAEAGRLQVHKPPLDWQSFGALTPPVQRSVPVHWLLPDPTQPIPVVGFRNAVITESRPPVSATTAGALPAPGNGRLYAALLSRDGQWVTTALAEGLGEWQALASTYSLTGDVAVLGTHPQAMATAAERVLAMGGGICLIDHDAELCALPLPVLGMVSPLPMDCLMPQVQSLEDLLRQRGYQHEDPFYTLQFLSATHLPEVRLTPAGVVHVRTG
ncbi:MAG: amidohydrolase family protein, partial [Alicyclobacillus sp.]|nr:amidohydrolase family protein [Alicyclobacillus sp.]